MVQVLLHIGAHRTGTTVMQQFLRDRTDDLRARGISAFCPPMTRQTNLNAIRGGRIIVSEENMSGTMEGNIAMAELYPAIGENLARYPDLIRRADAILFSVRSRVDWWNSAIAFCLKRGVEAPSPWLLDRIAMSKRGWPDVVDDLKAAAPHATVFVREFGWNIDRPAKQLLAVTGWGVFDKPWGKMPRLNQRPNAEVNVFTPEQTAHLQERYAEDLLILAERADITFLQ